MPIDCGGFPASTFPDDCPGPAATWLDCRDPEHYFLRFMIPYRMHGGIIRQTIASQTDPGRKARYQARYAWLKTRWFGNAECYRDATATLGPPRQPSARRACDGCARASGAERAAGAPPGRATGVRPTARPSQAS